MAISLILFGLLSGSLLAVLVGLFGAQRKIGFTWAFILSLLLTPIGGLICALISDPQPTGERRWGCLPYIITGITIAMIVLFILALMA